MLFELDNERLGEYFFVAKAKAARLTPKEAQLMLVSLIVNSYLEYPDMFRKDLRHITRRSIS